MTQTRPWGSANFPQTPEKFSGMEIGRKGEDTGKESKNNSAPPPPQQRKQATSKQKQERKAKQRRRAYSILQTEAFHYYSKQKHSFTLASLLDYQSRVT